MRFTVLLAVTSAALVAGAPFTVSGLITCDLLSLTISLGRQIWHPCSPALADALSLLPGEWHGYPPARFK